MPLEGIFLQYHLSIIQYQHLRCFSFTINFFGTLDFFLLEPDPHLLRIVVVNLVIDESLLYDDAKSLNSLDYLSILDGSWKEEGLPNLEYILLLRFFS